MSTPEPRSAGAAPVGPLAGRRILVVDDNSGTATLLAGAFQDAGATVDVSRGADAASAQAARRAPALVVIHLPLPKDAAANLASRLRRQPSLADVPIAILAGEEGVDDATTEAADILQTRPMSPGRLVDDVARLMQGRP